MSTLSRIGRRLSQGLRREDGSAAVEFVLFAPTFVFLFVSCFEVAFINIRQVMLDRALDLTVRELRLGRWPNPTIALVKDDICSHVGNLISDCSNQLMIELTPVPRSNWQLPDPGATCVDRAAEMQPATTFDAGSENQMMIVRACLLVDPFFPGTELALMLESNQGDGHAIVAVSGFVNEPFAGGS
ncbi:TadE/TadG family type IV pilus assembly protein [Actibacterium sp.]|uniref:TadE/TadG family type IV pilus assembly protein n=1 Tax=Actibacterium sp. TaxID=1872125 RepID=UPI0035652D2D